MAWQSLMQGVHAAIEFNGQLTDLVHFDEFDAKCEAIVKAIVTQSGEVERSVVLLEGFRDRPSWSEG